MHKIKYALFYDFHTSPLHPDVGKNFDAEKITDRFVECGIDYVTFHARCNMGMAYYNTRIGTQHPSLNFDLFGQLAEACHRKGIAIGAYFNAGLSRAEGVAHRDWTMIFPNGESYHEPYVSPFSMTMCYNSEYGEHLIAMAKEVAEKYPVSGFFFDCMFARPCVCPNCIRKMREQGIDFRNEAELNAIAFDSRNQLARRISKALKEIDPEYLIYFNDVPFEVQKEFGTYLEFECLPCKSGGYQYMHTQPHYMRTLGKQCVHMTGRFNQWSDFGGMRNAKTLKYELFFALANGLRPNIGDHLNPLGHIEAVFDRCKEVFGELHKYDRWFDSVHPRTDAAIVWHKGEEVRVHPTMYGAIRMLMEMRMQFDIVTEAVPWEKYSLLVLPDSLQLSEEMYHRIQKHLAKGGKLLVSGTSGLNAGNTFPKEWGVKFVKDAPFTPAYFQMLEPGIVEDMPLAFYEAPVEVKALKGTKTTSVLVRPALNREWDGLYPEYYNPPYGKTDIPFISYTDGVAYVSGKIFKGYAEKAAPQVRCAVSDVLQKIGYESELKLIGAPAFLQAYEADWEKGLLVSLLAYLPEKRGSQMESVEDELTAGGFKLAVRMKADPARAYFASTGTALDFTRNGEYIELTVPQFTGFGMVVFENQ